MVRPLVAAAQARVWVTAPWVTTSAADLFFSDLITRLRAGESIDVRIVYRLKGADDLTISDLDALDRLGDRRLQGPVLQPAARQGGDR